MHYDIDKYRKDSVQHARKTMEKCHIDCEGIRQERSKVLGTGIVLFVIAMIMFYFAMRFDIYVTDHKIPIINNMSELIGYAWI